VNKNGMGNYDITGYILMKLLVLYLNVFLNHVWYDICI